MTTFTSWDTELYHFGILGMKWGVRRFQNKDGSLTPAGEKRYAQLTSKQDAARQRHKQIIRNEKMLAGIYEKGGVEYARRGTVFQRMADSGEKIDSRRKYVSMLQDDNRRYESYARNGFLNNKNKLNPEKYIYEAKRDLKIAGEKDVSDYVLGKYGNDELRKIYDGYQNQRKVNELQYSREYNKLSGKEKRMVEQVRRSYEQNKRQIYGFLENALTRNERISSEVFGHFSKQGYDAMIDIQDSLSMADYPLILLNPKNSVRKKE